MTKKLTEEDEAADEIVKRLKGSSLSQMKIETQVINAPSRKLNAKWTYDIESTDVIYTPEKHVPKKLSREEEAEEIIRRLQAPPKKQYADYTEEFFDILAKEIADEIDAAMIQELTKLAKGLK